MKHPMQPLYDNNGVTRFKPNKIVRFLLDWSQNKGMGLNELAMLPFDDEDREQLAQLIGYSISGYGELSYVSNESYTKARQRADEILNKKKGKKQ